MLKILKKMLFSVSSESVAKPVSDPFKQAEIFQIRGNAFLAAGELDKAERCYLDAVAACGDYADAYINLGFVLREQKRSSEAVLYIQRAIEIRPNSPDGYYMLAAITRDGGDAEQAIAHFDTALALQPDFQTIYGELSQVLVQQGQSMRAKAVLMNGITLLPAVAEFHFFLANVQMALAEHDDAESSLHKALSMRADFIEAQYALGDLLGNLGRLEEAVTCFDKLLQTTPRHVHALVKQGGYLLRLKRPAAALDRFDRALCLEPDELSALMARGEVLLGFQRNEEALATCERVAHLIPDSAEAHLNKSAALLSLQEFDSAIVSCQRALEIKSDYVDAFINLGTALSWLNRYEEALATFDRALATVPENVDALLGRGGALQRLNRHDESLAIYAKVIDLQPDYVETYLNRGHTQMVLNRSEEALQSFAEVTKRQPDHIDAHFNESLCRLAMGDFKRGWELYEWRWRNQQQRTLKRNFVQPLWLGKESLYGKTILLHAEQGNGDTIQFCRFIPLVAEKGGKVILEVQAGLKQLLAGLPGVSRILAHGEALPLFDYHCPLMSLPLALETRLETIPSVEGCIAIESEEVAAWRDRLGNPQLPRIGVVWSGSMGHKNDRNRSIPFSIFNKLLPQPVQLVSLQKETRPLDEEILYQDNSILHFGSELKDFSDTAALIANLDLVIAVDTAVAHLAGTMGKPVWVLLPFGADWRWLIERTDSPWYVSARLFRQPGVGDWDSVLDAVAQEIKEWCQTRCDSPAPAHTIFRQALH